MRAVVLAALLALSTCVHAVLAGSCEPALGLAQPNLEQLAASGLPTESLHGDEMARALAVLRGHIEFDETPTRIVVIYGESRAAVWLIEGESLCNILYGPADGVREIVKAARGQGV